MEIAASSNSKQIGIILLFAWLACSCSPAQSQIEFHVAIQGHDDNLGTRESPFRTPERAQSQVRDLVASGLTDNVVVIVQEGVYELPQTFAFDARDSGTDRFSVTYQSAPQAEVTWSGGTAFGNWQLTEQGHWEIELPAVTAGKWFFRQLVVEDQRATRSRWPNNDGSLHLQTVDDAVKTFSFDQPLTLENPADQRTELIVFGNWSVARAKVIAADGDYFQTATAMGWLGHGPMTTASPGKTAYLEHHRSFLDQPGEWFLDSQTGILTYLPRANQNPQTALGVAPRLSRLLEIQGSPEKAVRNLRFTGICFAHCGFPLPEMGFNEIQASHYGTQIEARTFVQSVAIECTYAAECQFVNCRFAHLNNSAIGFGAGCRDNHVTRSIFEDVGGSGIIIGWRGKDDLDNDQAANLAADWRNKNDAPQRTKISDCIVRRCGNDGIGGVGIYAAFSKDTLISHNEIYDLPYSGISIGYRWSDEPTTQSHCIVENNHIFNVMQKLADGGGIYTLGRQPGTIIRNNYIHDVKRSGFAHGGAPNNGIFIDQGSTDFLFASNVIRDTSGDPIRFNQSKKEWHRWDNNYLGNLESNTPSAKKIIQLAGPSTSAPARN